MTLNTKIDIGFFVICQVHWKIPDITVINEQKVLNILRFTLKKS